MLLHWKGENAMFAMQPAYTATNMRRAQNACAFSCASFYAYTVINAIVVRIAFAVCFFVVGVGLVLPVSIIGVVLVISIIIRISGDNLKQEHILTPILHAR